MKPNRYEKEKFSSYEIENYAAQVARNGGISIEQAKQMVAGMMGRKSGGLINPSGQSFKDVLLRPLGVANFQLQIKRLTHDIAETLPIPLFAVIHSMTAYREMIAPYLPVGVTLSDIQIGLMGSTVNLADANKVVLQFDDGVNQDLVEITTNGIPYPSHLQALYNTIYRMECIVYKISDSTKQEQFAALFQPWSKTVFGKQGSNELTINSFQNPYQFQNGLVEVNGSIDIDSETGIVVGVIDSGVNNFIVTLNAFVSQFLRADRKML